MISSGIYAFVTFTLLVRLGQTEKDYEDESLDKVSQKVNNLQVEGAEYLQKVIKQIQDDRSHPPQLKEISNFPGYLYTHEAQELDYHEDVYNYVTPIYNISAPTPVPRVEAEIIPNAAPSTELSKEDLVKLYEAAVVQAAQLPLQQLASNQIQKVQSTPEVGNIPVKPAQQGVVNGPLSGYYYYYFPIKSFFIPTKKPEIIFSKTTPASVTKAVTKALPQQLHATITVVQSPNKSTMEPLFMAISGFIGFALMFLLSILFSPKYHKIRSKNALYKDTPDDLANFAVLVVEAMAGKDCSERLACEVTRIFKGLKANNKPLRILEIILPQKLSYQISQIRKAAGKRANCGYIPCKRKKPPAKPPNQKPKKKETPHDLWMKHFENKKNVIPRPKPLNQKQRQQNKYNYYHHQEQKFRQKSQKKAPPKKT